MKRIFVIICIIFGVIANAGAQTIKIYAPGLVSVGDKFRVEYTIESVDVNHFHGPKNISGLNILSGPNQSTSQSITMINGKTSRQGRTKFTYIVMATKPGTYTIPGASASVNGKPASSSTTSVKVNAAGSGSSAGASSSSSTKASKAGNAITQKDLFVVTTVNKSKVYEQEAILLTYKIYTLVELNQFALNMPDMKGFHTQEVPLSKEKTFEVERRNGINYNTCVWSQYVLFPQQSGKLEIPALKAEAVILQDNGADDPFDAMLNGNGKVPVKKFIPTPKITIDVMPLPSKPENFSGAVGDFDIKSEVNSSKLKENETLTLKITVEGNGNMKLLTAPKVEVPSELEAYDPKVTDNTELTPNGVKGSKTFEYMFIPRSKGEYTIPAVEFVYFDLKTKRYKTVKSKVFTIHVEKGDGTSKSNATADYTKRDDDIHSIKLGDEDLYPINDNLFGSFTFYLGFIIPLVVFVIAYFVIRKIMADNANVTKKRKKGAGKLANKRLQVAGEMMNRQDDAFFDEILRSLSGYVANKFNIPTVDMTKENILAKLSEAGVSADVANELVDVLDECQFAKFAPGNADDKMQALYGKASDIINKLDNLLSK